MLEFWFWFCWGFLCSDHSYRKKQNTYEVPSAGCFIQVDLSFLWLFGQKCTSALGFVCSLCICSLPVSYLSAAFLRGVFYSTWTTRKVCTKLNLLNLVNNPLCVDAVMYFWERKKNTKGTLSSSKTLVRNGPRALKDPPFSKCCVNFRAVHYLHYWLEPQTSSQQTAGEELFDHVYFKMLSQTIYKLYIKSRKTQHSVFCYVLLHQPHHLSVVLHCFLEQLTQVCLT